MTAESKRGRVLQGIVVSDKMEKTIVVRIDRRVKHKLYKKFITLSNKVHVHDPEGQCVIGDRVAIQESKPISKTKCWKLLNILDKAG